MRKLAFIASNALVCAACSVSPPAVQVTLSNATFGTTGGNLFNCTTPDRPANFAGVNLSPIGCEPLHKADGSFDTKPVIVSEQVGCSDGHGAIVTVTCAGAGTGRDVTASVSVSILASCDSSNPAVGSSPQSFTFQDVAPGDSQTSATLESCAVFDNFCPSSNDCAFNQFQAAISVSNTTR